MRPITFEEREDLMRRAGDTDVLEFVEQIQWNARRHRISQQKVLTIWLHAPRETDLPRERMLKVRNVLATRGTEMTPDEIKDALELITCKIRNGLRDIGWSEDMIPDSDKALLEMVHEQYERE